MLSQSEGDFRETDPGALSYQPIRFGLQLVLSSEEAQHFLATATVLDQLLPCPLNPKVRVIKTIDNLHAILIYRHGTVIEKRIYIKP